MLYSENLTRKLLNFISKTLFYRRHRLARGWKYRPWCSDEKGWKFTKKSYDDLENLYIFFSNIVKISSVFISWLLFWQIFPTDEYSVKGTVHCTVYKIKPVGILFHVHCALMFPYLLVAFCCNIYASIFLTALSNFILLWTGNSYWNTPRWLIYTVTIGWRNKSSNNRLFKGGFLKTF